MLSNERVRKFPTTCTIVYMYTYKNIRTYKYTDSDTLKLKEIRREYQVLLTTELLLLENKHEITVINI